MKTAAQFLARTHVEPISTGLCFATSIRPGQALEICGPSGTAKSEILIQVCLTSCMRDANMVVLAVVEVMYCLGELSGHGDTHPFETLAGAACWRTQRYTGSQDASVGAHGAFMTCCRLGLEPIFRCCAVCRAHSPV